MEPGTALGKLPLLQTRSRRRHFLNISVNNRGMLEARAPSGSGPAPSLREHQGAWGFMPGGPPAILGKAWGRLHPALRSDAGQQEWGLNERRLILLKYFLQKVSYTVLSKVQCRVR